MNWYEVQPGYYSRNAEEALGIEDVRLLIDKLLADVIPRHATTAWDYLRVEFWPDSGRMIVFPAASKNRSRIDKAGCQVVLGTFVSFFETLADSDMDDKEFSTEIMKEERRLATLFINAAQGTHLKGTRVVFFNADEEPAIADTVIGL